ncbi:acetolactate decarboxylase [soil metagenome]
MATEIYQVSDFEALVEGHFDGGYAVRDLEKHGDFGLGTFNELDGEMVVLEGRVYQASGFGDAHVPGRDAHTPFAFVTQFRPEKSLSLTGPLSPTELQAIVDGFYPEGILAIHVRGSFPVLDARSFDPEQKPYHPLAEISEHQHRFSFGPVQGDLVGYRMPPSVAEHNLNVPGYHFHFVSADRLKGGHVLGYAVESGILEVMPVERIVVYGEEK